MMKCAKCDKQIGNSTEVIVSDDNLYHKKCWKLETNERHGRPYECPKCKGEGYTVKTYNKYPPGLPDSGFVFEPGYENVTCNVCGGTGYTEKQKKPVIKTEIIGYD